MARFASFFEYGIPQAWLPDETHFSLCSRYHAISGNRLASTTCRLLFGHKTQGCAHDFPARLDHFLTVAGCALGPAADIVEDRTVLPFYLRFASGELAERVMRAALQTSSGALKFQLGLLTSRFRANHPLKACHECMLEDMRDHLTAYWHREHQLPGVWVCLRHRSWLGTSDLKATGVARFQWILPSRSQFPPPKEALPSKAVCDLAAMIAAVTTRRGLTLSQGMLRETYRSGLRSKGLLGGNGQRLRHDAAGSSYCAFLESLPRIDQLFGMPSSIESASAEIARLIGPVRSGVHPLRHLLLATWLFSSVDAFLEQYDDARRLSNTDEATPSAVPSTPISDGSDERKRQFVALFESGVSVSRAAHEVGVDTNTGMAWAASQGIATPRRPKLLVPEVRKAVIRLLRRGVAKDKAAAAGNVSVQTITNLLRSEVGLHEAWKEAQFQSARRRSRQRWRRCISGSPHSGVKAARLAEPAVYAWLYRNDRDWLKTQTLAMERVARSPQARVDWDERDRQLSDQVRRVALELHEAEPDRRIKLFQIYQRLPELKAKLFKLDRLPLTKSVLFMVLGKA